VKSLTLAHPFFGVARTPEELQLYLVGRLQVAPLVGAVPPAVVVRTVVCAAVVAALVVVGLGVPPPPVPGIHSEEKVLASLLYDHEEMSRLTRVPIIAECTD